MQIEKNRCFISLWSVYGLIVRKGFSSSVVFVFMSLKKYFIELLKVFVDADWVNEIDIDNIEMSKTEFVPRDFRDKEINIVYKLNLNGKEVVFFCLMELQSSVDYTIFILLFAII